MIKKEDENIKVKSLYKSLKILECFSATSPELGISEISNTLGIYKSNVHNILTTLQEVGYVYKNELTSKYGLTNKMLEYSYVITSQLSYENVICHTLKRISETQNVIAYFGVPHGQYVLYMFNAYPKTYENDYPLRSIMGEKASMYCTALGKAMLSTMPKSEVLSRINMERVKFTENTLVNEDEILEDLRSCSGRGYSIDNIEHEYNVKCVGVPILNRANKLIGGLSVSGSAHTFGNEKIDKYGKLLTDIAFEIKGML